MPESDCEVESMSTDLCLIDPFSKQRMKNPVKNKICGHVFDKDTVVELIRQRKKKGVR